MNNVSQFRQSSFLVSTAQLLAGRVESLLSFCRLWQSSMELCQKEGPQQPPVKLFPTSENKLATRVHRSLKVVAFWHSYGLREHLHNQHNNVAVLSEKHLEPRNRFLISNYHSYRTERLLAIRGRTIQGAHQSAN